MNLVTIYEKDGTKTRLSIGVDNIAFGVATFFRKNINLAAILETIEESLVIEDEQEVIHAERYMNEWREFDKVLVAVKLKESLPLFVDTALVRAGCSHR